MKTEIFETIRNGNYTRRFRCFAGNGTVAFNLPGRGGRTTRSAARRIQALWGAGKSAFEIEKATNCSIVW